MNIKKVKDAREWFSVLQTGKRTQTAIMTLKRGKSSGEEAAAHRSSDQVLLVLNGELVGELEGKRKTLKEGDVIIIPAGTRHKFTNEGRKDCVTFNTYSPPEY